MTSQRHKWGFNKMDSNALGEYPHHHFYCRPGQSSWRQACDQGPCRSGRLAGYP
jgi:hypothetical protein